MFSLHRSIVQLFLFIFLSFLFATSASAHFKLNLNVRIFHVEHLSDGLNVYMRLPMPYLVAHLLGEIDENGLPSPAPYTNNRLEDGKLVHYVDVNQLKNSTDGLALLAMRGLDLSVEGESINAKIESFRIYKNGTQLDFATLDDAKKDFQVESIFD
jgi:hypothetical protein